MPIYLMSIRVLLSVELCVTLKTYLKGAPFYNAWEAAILNYDNSTLKIRSVKG